MGGEPKFESSLVNEAQTNTQSLTRKSAKNISSESDEEQTESKTKELTLCNAEPIKARRSLEAIDSESKDEENENIKIQNLSRKSRGSHDFALNIEKLDDINHTESTHKKKKKKKSKNKLVHVLKECIDEFNKSMQSFSLLELMGTNSVNSVSTQFNQSELLDTDLICKWFRHKNYDIQWFLICKRNKFIKVMVNKWSKISILTTIHLYDALQERIHENTPSVSTSTLNLLSNNMQKWN